MVSQRIDVYLLQALKGSSCTLTIMASFYFAKLMLLNSLKFFRTNGPSLMEIGAIFKKL